MNNVQRYLAQSEQDANQKVMNATGNRKFGADGFLERSLYFTNDVNNMSEFYRHADGGNGGGGDAAPQQAQWVSQPYVLQISNASAARVSGVQIWGAATYLDNSLYTWNNGSLTVNGVTISSLMPSPATYRFILNQSQTNNFTVGRTTLISVSGTATQVLNNMNIQTADGNGNQASKVLTSPLSPMQFQSGVYENNQPYRVDGYTTLAIDVEASAVFKMFVYYSFNINLARGLGNQPIGNSFAAPQTTPVQPVRMIGS
jgi:hypothetical protein